MVLKIFIFFTFYKYNEFSLNSDFNIFVLDMLVSALLVLGIGLMPAHSEPAGRRRLFRM